MRAAALSVVTAEHAAADPVARTAPDVRPVVAPATTDAAAATTDATTNDVTNAEAGTTVVNVAANAAGTIGALRAIAVPPSGAAVPAAVIAMPADRVVTATSGRASVIGVRGTIAGLVAIGAVATSGPETVRTSSTVVAAGRVHTSRARPVRSAAPRVRTNPISPTTCSRAISTGPSAGIC